MSDVSILIQRTDMKAKILGSVILASAMATSASAGVELFGHLGALYDQGFGNSNDNGYAGFTGHLGVDIGNSEFGFGVGAWGGTKLWSSGGNNYGKTMYGTDYIDLSDLYIRYTGGFNFYAGRFNGDFLGADWIDNYVQGVSASFDTRHFGVWLTWANDWTTYGVLPGRIGSELAAYSRFPSSFNNFDIGSRDVFAAGMRFDLGFLQIDPFFHYWLNNNVYTQSSDIIQAGAKLGLIFGSDMGVKSITSARFMWQNWHTNTFLFWIDEELRFNDTFKFGAGWYIIGNNGSIMTMADHSRFYGRYTTYSTNGSSYFTSGTNAWYVFGGVEHNRFKLDVLYADGDYHEFSAVFSVRVFNLKCSFMREGLGLDVGAGYVNNGFTQPTQTHNGIVFAKLVF